MRKILSIVLLAMFLANVIILPAFATVFTCCPSHQQEMMSEPCHEMQECEMCLDNCLCDEISVSSSFVLDTQFSTVSLIINSFDYSIADISLENRDVSLFDDPPRV